MVSIHDKLAQAKYEDKLKATILGELIGVLRYFTADLSTALAKGVYAERKDRDTEYDVVTGFIDPEDKTAMLAWVISYEEGVHGLERTYHLQSKQCTST